MCFKIEMSELNRYLEGISFLRVYKILSRKKCQRQKNLTFFPLLFLRLIRRLVLAILIFLLPVICRTLICFGSSCTSSLIVVRVREIGHLKKRCEYVITSIRFRSHFQHSPFSSSYRTPSLPLIKLTTPLF